MNDILAKGPNMLNNLWELMIRFRAYRYGLISDITKAYHSMRTALLEMNLRHVVWGHANPNLKWKVYRFTVVAFGYRPAAALLEIVIKKAVKMFGQVDPIAASRLNKDMFVDDLETGGELHKVTRFKGEENTETLECSGTIPDILRRGGLRLKAIQISGEEDGPKLEKLGGFVLGLGWSSKRDTLTIDLSVNVTKRKRGIPSSFWSQLRSKGLTSLEGVESDQENLSVCSQ